MLQQHYDYLALEGGGTKGFIYIGVAEELKKLGVLDNLKGIAGTSVGAIGALLFATGWDVERIKAEFVSKDFAAMSKGGLWDKIKVPWNAVFSKGLYSGSGFHQWFKDIIKAVTGNENCDFETWHQLKEQQPVKKMKDLVIEACNINVDPPINESFSHLSPNKKVPIWKAVAASMAFPSFFMPVEINGCLYRDGGLQKNCPSDDFEEEIGKFNPRVLTIRLDSKNEIDYMLGKGQPKKIVIKTSPDDVFATINAATSSQTLAFYSSPYKDHTVFCDSLGVSTLEFELDEASQKALIASGAWGVARYFAEKHPEVARQVYDAETLKAMGSAGLPLSIMEFVKSQAVQPDLEVVGAKPQYKQWCSLPKFKEMREKKETKEKELVLSPAPRKVLKYG